MSICENCGAKHDSLYGSGRFCKQACSRSFATSINRDSINKQKSETVRAKFNYHQRECPVCHVHFVVSDCKVTRVCCSKSCARKLENANHPEKLIAISRLGGLKSVSSQNKRSKNEIYFAQLCQDKFGSIMCNQQVFDGWDADVILTDYNVAILWNGVWHYKQVTKSHSLKQVQNRDKIKMQKIYEHGYTPYVIKDMGRYSKDFVNLEFEHLVEFIEKRISSEK